MKPKPSEAALIGCLGGLFATACVYPLDLAKSKVGVHIKTAKKENISAFTVLRSTLRADGIGGLYKGFCGRAVQCLAEDFIFFWSLALVKSKLHARIVRNEKVERPLNVAEDLAAGGLSGVVNNFCTLPFDVVATNHQFRNVSHKRPFYMQYADTAKIIRDKGGVLSFWNGLLPSCLLVVNPAVNFALFEKLKELYVSAVDAKKASHQGFVTNTKANNLNALEVFLIGAVSKAFATIISYPLIRAKILMMDSIRQKDGKPQMCTTDKQLHTMLNVLSEAIRSEGIFGGLYKGVGAQLSRSTLAAAIMFTTREKLESCILHGVRSLSKTRTNAIRRLKHSTLQNGYAKNYHIE